MIWSSVLSKLFDPYDLKARVFPGLLLLIPAIVFIALILGRKDPLIVTLSSVLATCGGPYLIASVVRTWGQRAQDRLNKRWGGQPSTIILRHSDSRMATPTKLQYHQLIQQKLSINVPTAADEAYDSESADQAYTAAANALRPLVNADKKRYPFVFKELVAYGFNRNAYGSRWVGVFICAAAILATLVHGAVLKLTSPYGDFAALAAQDAAHVLTLVVAGVFMLVWLLHFTDKTVEQAGYTYALRLWEALLTVKKPPPKSYKATSPNAASGTI
ncbi:hypothetical protein FHW58_004384 [Duganella sp. 1224]|uniref:hypothetical protein n=1 Tax=Duganella sp. 1224 TaxID=2587052 RepID=UPI0015C9BD70|nr:hypothetical protein [Duganella sp. 1224]NYE63156.1 hypothetical protein [Duganella sp. 1224]